MRSPAQIQQFVDENLWRFDLGVQYLGDEPNAALRDWDSSTVRMLIMASWDYSASAGNSSIPSVYCAVHRASEQYLCDRFYLPATPRDMRMLEKNGIPVFGIESKHALTDFDVVATSISYPVLTMSFVKMLNMSGIPVRWKDRTGDDPFVLVGGQAYAAPEVLAPVVDAFYLGEVEDEPGNPGLGRVLERIEQYKAQGRWQSDRVGCYEDMAREFSYLYFPRFVEVRYGYQDRNLEQPSKQVVGYVSLLDGMRMPFERHYVKVLDSIPPLDAPPLLYNDAGNAAGDAEVARGSVAQSEYVLVEGEGLRSFASWGRDILHPHDADLGVMRCDVAGEMWPVSHVITSGHRDVVRVLTDQGHGVVCTPDHEISAIRGPFFDARRVRKGEVAPDSAVLFSYGRQGVPSRLDVLEGQPTTWVRADSLTGGDVVPVYYGQNVWATAQVVLHSGAVGSRSVIQRLPEVLDGDVAWFLGMLAGDSTVRYKSNTPKFPHRLQIKTEDPGVASKVVVVLERLFGVVVTPYAREGARSGSLVWEIRSKDLMEWLDVNFRIVDNITRRRVPEQILRSPREVVAEFLSGFYDSDGTYDTRTGRPSWTSQSEELIRVVSLLLLNLGAPCSLRQTSPGPRGVKPLWRVQGLKSADGDWLWLQPSHTRRIPWVELWQGSNHLRFSNTARNGVIYCSVTGVEDAGSDDCFDISVPEKVSFTCNGIHVHNCPAWCSFCRLTFVTKPYRQRSTDYMVDFGKSLKRNMGGTHIAYVAPDFPMHTAKKALTKALVENVTDEVDGAAMRIDDFSADTQFVELSSYAGMDAVTLGLEGASQRMRDLVGKGVSDQETREVVRKALEAGVRKVKLFMISNLPGEDKGDIMKVVQLARDLAEIRDSMGKSNVVIQMSWTPLLIEANTPFQWFAPTPANYDLAEAWNELRDLRVDAKIGTKAEVNKVTFFQLCQRASRDIGEALVDTMLELNVACWGGVPKTTRDLLDQNMRKWGFLNGLEDAFDERGKDDLFGWEFISTGVSQSLLWDVYRQMVEFLEITDSQTYDDQFQDGEYHGAEWLPRCDEQCQGKACGACDRSDLEIRKGYTRLDDEDIDLSSVTPIDERSVAVRIRARVHKSEAYRMVTNDHWRFNLRRALYRAKEQIGMGANIVKRSLVFASDSIGFKDWTHGTDYVEFALTKPVPQSVIADLVAAANQEMVSGRGQEWMQIGDWKIHPPTAMAMRNDVDLTLYEVEIEEELGRLQTRLREWEQTESVDMTIRAPATYFGPTMQTVNAKEYVDALWIVRDGHRVLVRMLLRGRPSPYNVMAAFMGSPSWLEYAKYPARRVDSFVEWDTDQWDFFFPACQGCGVTVPVNVLEEPFNPDYCPRCADQAAGRIPV